MSFYTNIGAVIAAQKYSGYCPPPQKPSFWDTWMAGVLVFLVTLAILVVILFATAPSHR